MLYTLGLFLSEQERKLSRLSCTPPSSLEGDHSDDFYNYEPNLYLQGFILVRVTYNMYTVYISYVYTECIVDSANILVQMLSIHIDICHWMYNEIMRYV